MKNVKMCLFSKVLRPVFKKLPFKDLRRIRLVSRAWNNIVCNATTFGDECEVIIRDDPNDTLDSLTKGEFLIWKNFSFITSHLDNSTEVQKVFWERLGRGMTSLSLIAHSLTPSELLSVLRACPNLESLTLSCRDIYGSDLWTNLGRELPRNQMGHVVRLVRNVQQMRLEGFLAGLTKLTILESNSLPHGVLRDFLLLAPNVDSLTLVDNNMTSIPHWDGGDIIRFVSLRPEMVKKLELTGPHIYPEYIGAIANLKGLNLTSLHLRYAKLTDTSILSLLKTQRNLEELDLSYTTCSQLPFLHLECSFQKLKRLILRGFSSNINSFAFLSRMPRLEELDLAASFSSSMNWALLIDCFLQLQLKSLKSLNLSLNMGLGVFPQATLFTALMESLTHITCINLSQNSFMRDTFVHDIWSHLRHLRTVFLESLTAMSTEGITGISHAQMQNALSNGTEWNVENIDPELMRFQNCNGAYIGLCSGIEILSLGSNTRLNDFAIMFGVANLPNLQKLRLKGCHQLTTQSLRHVVKRCPRLEYLDIRETSIPNELVQWAKEINPHLRRVLTNSMAENTEQDYEDVGGFGSLDPRFLPLIIPHDIDDGEGDDDVDLIFTKKFEDALQLNRGPPSRISQFGSFAV